MLLIAVGLGLLVLGSNWLVDGSVAFARALGVSDLVIGLTIIAVAIACLPVFVAGREIGRGKGLLFLAYYVAYVAYLVLDARGHDLLPKFSAIMLGFVLPITIVTLVAMLIRNQSNNPPADAG